MIQGHELIRKLSGESNHTLGRLGGLSIKIKNQILYHIIWGAFLVIHHLNKQKRYPFMNNTLEVLELSLYFRKIWFKR